ncbi:MAG TPA: pyridoxamine 5'-phosphate oxidase family protein [Acidimicrobiia bacterium]|nr:pyridoxamine 5'-phosphate oxidase family protein [Acidimicrobiia bacterium]
MERLTHEEALELLDARPVAHIGLISGDSPYVTPMSYVRDGDRILFRTEAGKKLDALRDNPAVCIEVSVFDEETGDWASVIVNGTAREATADETKQAALDGLIEKYSDVLGDLRGTGGLQPLPGFPHVIEVSIDEISGMSSGRGFSFRTRPGRL